MKEMTKISFGDFSLRSIHVMENCFTAGKYSGSVDLVGKETDEYKAELKIQLPDECNKEILGVVAKYLDLKGK